MSTSPRFILADLRVAKLLLPLPAGPEWLGARSLEQLAESPDGCHLCAAFREWTPGLSEAFEQWQDKFLSLSFFTFDQQGDFLEWCLARPRFFKLYRAWPEEALLRQHQQKVLAEQHPENRLASGFLANISHELRTPLNTILGLAQALAQNEARAEVRGQLEGITSAGWQLLKLLNDVLQLSRIQAGLARVEPSEVFLPALLRELEEMFDYTARRKGVRFLTHHDPHAPATFWLDQEKLRQILFNLVGNALRHTEQGQVSLGLLASCQGAEECQLCFTITDTGSGIPEDLRPRLFEPFQNEKTGARGAQRGSGLGLPMAWQLSQLMGGRLSFESQVGKGTTFALVLDKAKPVAGAGKASSGTDEGFEFLPARILVAEDVYANQLVLSALFEGFPFTLQFADNGQQALEALEKKHFHLVFLDLLMPVMDGIQAARAIRGHKLLRLRETQLVALTASVENEHSQLVGTLFDAFVPKPIRPKQLLEVLKAKLRTRPLTTKPPEPGPASPPSWPPQARQDFRQALDLLRAGVETFSLSELSEACERLVKLAPEVNEPIFSQLAQKLRQSVNDCDLDAIREAALALRQLGRGME